MAKPTASYPTTVLSAYQELATHLDTNGVIAQKTDVTLTAIYVVSGIITITVTGAFTNWPAYGVIENQTTNEQLFYYSKTNNDLLIKSNGRGINGTTPTAGAIGQLIRFIEIRCLGKAINQLFAEVTSLETELGAGAAPNGVKGSLANLIARLGVSINPDGTIQSDIITPTMFDSTNKPGGLNVEPYWDGSKIAWRESHTTDEKVKADDTDPSANYLNTKVDGITIIVDSDTHQMEVGEIDNDNVASDAGILHTKINSIVEAKTSTYDILLTDRNKLFTNEGSSGERIFNLPECAAGVGPFGFYVQNNDGAGTIKIKAQSGDTIQNGAGVSSSGGYLTSASTVGHVVWLMGINNNEWIVIGSIIGTWTAS